MGTDRASRGLAPSPNMESQFTCEETRFVLSEIIRTSSQIGVNELAQFIRTNGITPDWMNMKLPGGRTANQCKLAFDEITNDLAVKRRRTSEQSDEHPRKKLVSSHSDAVVNKISAPEPQSRRPSSSSLVSIAPRPPNGLPESPPNQGPTVSSPAPRAPSPPQAKKRGRPSRADKAKKDLRPQLPPVIAPRPPNFPGQSTSQVASPAGQMTYGTHHPGLLPPIRITTSSGDLPLENTSRTPSYQTQYEMQGRPRENSDLQLHESQTAATKPQSQRDAPSRPLTHYRKTSSPEILDARRRSLGVSDALVSPPSSTKFDHKSPRDPYWDRDAGSPANHTLRH
jgi:hypothetical protein